MRQLMLAVALVAVALAGCAEDAPEEPTAPVKPLPVIEVPETPSPVTHADYGFVTRDALLEGTMDDFPAPGVYNGTFPPGSPFYWKKPAYHNFSHPPSSIDFLSVTSGISGGNGIAVFGPLAIVGTSAGPMHVVNIMNPGAPEVVSVVDVPVRDASFIAYPDGKLMVVTSSGGGSLFITDVTDPHNPELASTLQTPNTNHNLNAVPGTPIIYNSPSDGGRGPVPVTGEGASDGVVDIIDATDPYNPIVVRSWENGYGCHDSTFYMNADEGKYRGYCAGVSALQIWDLTNVTNPSVISEWGWPSGGVHDAGSASLVSFAHLAIPNHDASILILGDESGGGAAPACDFSVNDPVTGTTVTGPLGNLWFYDITDETAPILKGSYSPNFSDVRPSPIPNCTAHFGEVIEDTNHVAMSFYSAGVVMVDFTDPQNPVEAAHYESPAPVVGEGEGPGSVWDVWYYQGYLFTGDMSKGMDVLQVN